MDGSSVWLIAGPTASGKSALALALAEAVGGEILNADSMQVYGDLRILTARPSAGDTARVPHHLDGVADGAEAWSVGRWLRAAEGALSGIAARGQAAVVVGGTGLYFRALTQGIAPIPPVPEGVRADVEVEFEAAGEAAFRQRLHELDPAAASRIARGDRQRLIRAMAVAQATGRALSDWQGEAAAPLVADYRSVIFDPAREDLYARCDARLGAMVDEGALTEVAALMARGLDPKLPVMKALGVPELDAHLRGEMSLDAALDLARQSTRRYAKRQTTWFRNQTPDWPRMATPDLDALLATRSTPVQIGRTS